jgi:hypothetical protein
MVGEIDSLSSVWRAPQPPRLHTAENTDADGEEFRDHVVSNSFANLTVLRTQVSSVPRLIRMSITNSE